MSEKGFGFDAFAEKWVPPPPAWRDPGEAPAWVAGATEDERRDAYLRAMAQAGGDGYAFSPELQARLRRDAAAGVPILTLLDGLLGEPEIRGREAIVVLFQRVFGVPLSRAGYIASWQPANRRPETEKVLQRIAFCVADAHRAGQWSERVPGENR